MIIRTLALCLIASPLAAETVCIPRADLIAKLDNDYAELQMVRAEKQLGEVFTRSTAEATP